MAEEESIKAAFRALEEEVCWAESLARCLVAAAGDQGLAEPPWVNHFHHVVGGIAERFDAFSRAYHHVE